MFVYLFAALIGYLLGSIPTSYLTALALSDMDSPSLEEMQAPDPSFIRRTVRAAGAGAALLSILLDVLKGALAVILVRLVWGQQQGVIELAAALAGLFVVIGHNYSLFLRFKGGAGTLTALGALGALYPLLMLLSSVIPLLFLYITKVASIAALLGSSIALLLGGTLIWQGYLPPEAWVFLLPYFLLSWFSHRLNVQRLREGTERRIGGRAKA